MVKSYDQWLSGVVVAADIGHCGSELLPVDGFGPSGNIGKFTQVRRLGGERRIHTLVVSREQALLTSDIPNVRVLRAGTVAEAEAALHRSYQTLVSPWANESNVVLAMSQQQVLSENQPECIGRDWLIELLESEISKVDRGYVYLEAGPGFGKSVVMCELARRLACGESALEASFYGLHIFRSRYSDDPSIAVRTFCSEICKRYWLAPKAVDEVNTWLRETLLALETIHTETGSRGIIIWDGLDEAKQDTVRLPPPDLLPQGLVVLISARPEQSYEKLGLARRDILLLDVAELIEQDSFYQANNAGLKEYIDSTCDGIEREYSADNSAFVLGREVREALLDYAENGYLVPSTLLTLAENSIVSSSRDKALGLDTWSLDPAAIPRSLDGLMKAAWDESLRDVLDDHEIPARSARLVEAAIKISLALLFEFRSAVDRKMINYVLSPHNMNALYEGVEYPRPRRIGRWDLEEMKRALLELGLADEGMLELPERMGSLFWSMPEPDDQNDTTPYRVFHTYFAQWFRENLLHKAALEDVHRVLVWSCIRALGNADAPTYDYALEHLIAHCIEAGESALAAKLVFETSFGRKKLARTDNDHLPMLGNQLTYIFDDVPKDKQAKYGKQFELITDVLTGGRNSLLVRPNLPT